MLRLRLSNFCACWWFFFLTRALPFGWFSRFHFPFSFNKHLLNYRKKWHVKLKILPWNPLNACLKEAVVCYFCGTVQSIILRSKCHLFNGRWFILSINRKEKALMGRKQWILFGDALRVVEQKIKAKNPGNIFTRVVSR